MKEINEEIKLTINLIQSDICAGLSDEMQKHLNGLLEIKRNELHQRLVERSWLDHADGMGSVVKFDQAPYKSVKLEGQISDGAKPLTAEELKAGGWRCGDVSEECRLVFASKGVYARNDDWSNEEKYKCCYISRAVVFRSYSRMEGLKQIHRVGNEFYWSDAL